jgi:pimeloyl-ACP methyl ester carboxylesterase
MIVSARGLEFEAFPEGPEDGPAVLLLHGFPQNARQWDRVTPALHEAGLRTVAVNQRGYSPGARPTDIAAYALTECVDDALSIMDGLGVARFHVVGHDWGAAVAWHLTATHPDRVRTLTAISVPHPGATSTALHANGSDQRQRSSYMRLFADLDKAVPLLLEDDAQRLKALFLGSGLGDDEVEKYVGPLRDPAALRGALSWYAAIFAHRPPMAPAVTVPTTHLWSNGDYALGRVGAEACHRFVTADYRFIELDGVTHWIPDQAPEATIEAILARTGQST